MKSRILQAITSIFLLMAVRLQGQHNSIQEYEWIGISMGSTENGALSSPLSLVVEAYQQAKSGNRMAFDDLFEPTLQGNNPAEVDGLFTLWNQSSGIVYTLAVEAVLAGEAQRRAYLILPKAIDFTQDSRASAITPFVLFASDRGSGWKLTTKNLDPEATARLFKMAENHPLEMHQSDEAIQRKLDDFDRQYIAMLEESGMPRSMIIAEKQAQEEMNRGETIATWDDWQRVYRARFLTNQPAFSSLDPMAMDFSAPYAAWRSLLHAEATGKIEILLEMADEGVRTRMKSDSWYAKAHEGESRLTFSNLTWVVPLLQAETTVAEDEYVLFWSRSQDPQKGTEGMASFDMWVLRKVGDKYVQTDDMDRSYFVYIDTFAGPDDSMETIRSFGPYESWRAAWAKSKFPSYFYTIEDNHSPRLSEPGYR